MHRRFLMVICVLLPTFWGCDLLSSDEEHFYHEIQLNLTIVDPWDHPVVAEVSVQFYNDDLVTSTPDGLEVIFSEVASGTSDEQGRLGLLLSHEVPDPSCCHRVFIAPLDPDLAADSMEFSFHQDVYGGRITGLSELDLPGVVARRFVVRGSSDSP